MTVTVIALVTIAEDAPEALAAYLKVTEPLMARVGARIEKRFRITQPIVGDRPAQAVMVVHYPDRPSVDAVLKSPEYAKIIPIRDIAFLDYRISIAEDMSVDRVDSNASG